MSSLNCDEIHSEQNAEIMPIGCLNSGYVTLSGLANYSHFFRMKLCSASNKSKLQNEDETRSDQAYNAIVFVSAPF